MPNRDGIRNYFFFIGRIALFALFVSGCSGASEDGGSAPVQIVLKSSPAQPGRSKVSRAPAPEGISAVRLDVTGPGMDPLSTTSGVTQSSEVRLSLDVPAGPSRRFTVTMSDETGADRFRGAAAADLTPGTPAEITILMEGLDAPIPVLVISPSTAVVAKGTTQPFTVVSGADPADVDWSVPAGADPELSLGRITPDGVYTPPTRIPTDAATPIGNPIPVTVSAVDRTAPEIQSSATVHLTTGPVLAFDQNRPVTPSAGSISTQSSGQRSVAFHRGKVYAVWSEFIPRLQRETALFSESADGFAWSAPIPVDAGVNSQSAPVIAVGPDGAVYVAFVECPFCTSVPAPAVRLAVRPAGENGFRPVPLTMRGANPRNPAVAVSAQGMVYVAWSADQGSPSQYDLLLQRIDPAGNSIDPLPKNLTEENGAFNEDQPTLAAGEGEDLFLAWQVSANSTEIAAAGSFDGGNSFLPEVRINDTADLRSSVHFPSLAAGPGRSVYVAWEKDTCSDGCTVVYYNIVSAGPDRLAFGEERPVGYAVDLSVRQNRPSVGSDGAGGMYILFHETLERFASDAIFLAKSIDGGTTVAYSRVDDSVSAVRDKSAPSLAVDSAGRAFAIWTDGRNALQGNANLFFAKGE